MNTRFPLPARHSLVPAPARARALPALLIASVALGATAAPVIHSVDVQPTPLVVGEPFQITVDASGAATGIATVDFRPGSPHLARVVLAADNTSWTGTGVVPAPVSLAPGAAAIARVVMLDDTRRRAEFTLSVPVLGPSPEITAHFHPATGILEVRGTDRDDTIVVGAGAGGLLVVNDGSVPVSGGVPSVASTTLIRVLGFAGADTITMGPTGGAVIPADLRGGAGDDVLTGGPGPDTLRGGSGNDVLNGRPGADRVLGGPGEDRIVWNPGDSSDQADGDAGLDTLEFRGSAIGEGVELAAVGGRLRLTRNIASVVMDVGSVERVRFAALGGADAITVRDLSGTGVNEFTLDLSGPGTPGIGDGQGDQLFIEGTPADEVITATGEPTAFSITGLFPVVRVTGIDPTLDRLTVDGQGGTDTLVYQGTDDSDQFDLSTDGSAARISGQPGLPIVHAVATEQVRLEPRDSADLVVVGNLTATPLTSVTIDLATAPGDNAGDGQPDRVIVTGTAGNDTVSVGALGADVHVTGLSASVVIRDPDTTLDRLGITTLAGQDTIDASSLPTGLLQLDLNGGAEADLLTGSAGDDVLIGGQGSDLVAGGPGNDTILWNPGDNSDVIEGQDGLDTLIVSGANVGEKIALSASGSRLRFTRDIAAVNLDAAGTEIIAFRAVGGSDVITVGDLSGTDVTEVRLDLAQPAGSATSDGQPDTVIVDGTPGNDAIQVTGDGTVVIVSGLTARVSISGSEASNDVLFVAGNEGHDTIVASGLPAALINFQADGGEGDDSLFGSDGSDVLEGGPGDDLLVGGPGVDVLDGGSGSNVVVQ